MSLNGCLAKGPSLLTLGCLRGGHFDPTIFSKSNNFFWIFLCPLLLNSWVFTFLPPFSAVFMSTITLFWNSGALSRDRLEIFWFFEKMKKISKNQRADFFWIFFTWVVANYPPRIFSWFWEENNRIFIFFKNKSVFLKIAHFVQSWRKRVMNSIENEALVETSKCLYHIYRSKTSLFTLLCRLNSSVTNILLLNTFF